MRKIDLNPDQIVAGSLNAGVSSGTCILDSCGTLHRGSQRLLAGVLPLETFEITNRDADETLLFIDEILTGDKAAIFSISYDFGRKLERIGDESVSIEPDIFVALFDSLLIHDYRQSETIFAGNPKSFDKVRDIVNDNPLCSDERISAVGNVKSNFTRAEYLNVVEVIKESIRSGDTYQANLTQQISVDLPKGFDPAQAFMRIRAAYPAPFAARHRSATGPAWP